ncbi:MAG: cyclic pyranopterin monophosphate synthase MoaC [Verrucomicrobia bacterium]|nr:cyclic pyranopterin monophosphate synthase MoaC [Verrucomicrobiota bacterium]
MSFSHLDKSNNPRMVDVGGKQATRRAARAQAIVHLPDAVASLLQGDELMSPKGPVFQTAVIAGTMAAKKTSELIPLCHPIGLDSCDIDISVQGNEATIEAKCSVEHRTGVEMEALTAATVAALTIYDMCKGLSREIRIKDIRLLDKTGGKEDYHAS